MSFGNWTMKRIKDLEFRWSKHNKKYELVKWILNDPTDHSVVYTEDGPKRKGDIKEYCYVIAFFDKGKEGCDIRFIGDRPFSPDINHVVMWELMRYGQQIVDAEVALEDNLPFSEGELIDSLDPDHEY